MKRLSGWDAVLLYSETPNVHMHTLKVAVIELDADRRDFDIDAFRRVIHSRLYKLEHVNEQAIVHGSIGVRATAPGQHYVRIDHVACRVGGHLGRQPVCLCYLGCNMAARYDGRLTLFLVS